jgi:hypothetical protein
MSAVSVNCEPQAAALPELSPEEFAIMPWGGPWGDAKVDEATLKDLKDCGFNLAGFVGPDKVAVAKAAGLKCLVIDANAMATVEASVLTDEQVDQKVKALVDRVGPDDNVYGYFVCDEPWAHAYQELGKWVAAYKKYAPGKVAYINLLCKSCVHHSYQDYLDWFADIVKPAFYSFDNYSIYDDGTLRDTYYANLEDVRAAGLRKNLPFWNIILGNAHFNYAEPSDASLRFQVYTSMAYGARGITYFTYFTPTIGNYRMAAIDQFGHKTPTWDMARRINMQIQRLGKTFAKLKSVNVFHYPNVPAGCSGMDTSKYLAKVGTGDMLVGEFEGPDGQPFVMVVNKSMTKSTTFELQFKDPGKIQMINQYTGQIEDWAGEDNWLAPGQGMLLSLKK